MPDLTQNKSSRVPLWVYVLVITFIVFSSSLGNNFINWDDHKHVYQNPAVRSLDWAHAQDILTTPVFNTYIPLTILSFAVEYHFFGLKPWVYHLTNVLLHLAVTGLVFHFARQAGLRPSAAAFAALLFGIHPMHVEPVVWISARKDTLYAFFYMLALINYWQYLKEGKTISYLLTILLGLLSILAKPMALSLPLIFFVCDWLYGRRGGIKIFIEKIPHMMVIIPIALITYIPHARIPGGNLGETGLVWVWTFTFYIQKFIFPFICTPLYQLPQPVSVFNGRYALMIGFFLFLIFLFFRLRKNRWFIFAVLFYFVSIFFLLRYDYLKDVTLVADRFMYLPSLGLCLWLGLLSDRFLEYLKNKRAVFQRIGVFFLAFLLISLAVKTYAQTHVWKNSVVFWSYVIKHVPTAALAYANRSNVYISLGEVDLAEEDFQKASEVRSELAKGYFLRAQNYEQKGDHHSALALYDTVITYHIHYVEAYIARGDIYQNQGRFEAAIADYTKALERRPDDAKLYLVRGNTYDLKGRYDLGIADFNKAIAIDSQNARAYRMRGVAHAQTGEDALALEDFGKAVAIDPDDADHYLERGNFYLNREQYAQAVADYEQALGINPDYGHVYDQRGSAYLRWKKYLLALIDFNKFLEKDPGHIDTYFQRAEVYEKMNRWDKALSDYDRIIQIDMLRGKAYHQRSLLYKKMGNFKLAFQDALTARFCGELIDQVYIEELKGLIKNAPAF